jgi:hypothetical protein
MIASGGLHPQTAKENAMKKCLLVLATVALVTVPSAAFATFSVIQDSCRTNANEVTTFFSVVNFNSPVAVCDLHFLPENPVPGCIMIGCSAPVGWSCALNAGNLGADWQALTPADCISAGQIKRGFSFTLDPDFCCYLVTFTGPNHEELATQEECFNCVHVGVEDGDWGKVKKLYR